MEITKNVMPRDMNTSIIGFDSGGLLVSVHKPGALFLNVEELKTGMVHSVTLTRGRSAQDSCVRQHPVSSPAKRKATKLHEELNRLT